MTLSLAERQNLIRHQAPGESLEDTARRLGGSSYAREVARSRPTAPPRRNPAGKPKGTR